MRRFGPLGIGVVLMAAGALGPACTPRLVPPDAGPRPAEGRDADRPRDAASASPSETAGTSDMAAMQESPPPDLGVPGPGLVVADGPAPMADASEVGPIDTAVEGPGPFVPDPDSLRAHVSPGLPSIGAAIDTDALAADPAYRALAARELNAVTAENAMKWATIHPAPARWELGPADALVAFAEAHQMRVRGHTLVWHASLPPWLDDSALPATVQGALAEHIATLVGRYKGRIKVWDVVNEAIDDRGQPRDSLFLRKLGPGYIAEAFRLARAADPDAVLAYNDYGIEVPGPKADAVFALLRELRQAGAPVGAVGLQYHVLAYDFARKSLTPAALRAAIQRFGSLGLEVHITELDVRLADLEGTRESRLAYQEAVYRTVTEICRSEPACTSLTTWGFSDRYSWVDQTFGPDDPLLFDDALARKPAYQGVRAALAGAAGGSLDAGFATLCGGIAGALLCEPFESVKVPPGFYQSTGAGSVTVAAGRARFGRKALAARTDGGASSQAMVGRAFGARRGGALHARAFIYLPSTVASGADSTAVLFGVGEEGPPYGGVNVALQDGRVMLSATTSERYVLSTRAFPRDRWTCVALAIDVNDASGNASITLDGTPAVSATGIDTLPAGGLSNVNVGAIYSSPGHAPVEVFIDELAVGTQAIGCD